jgi:hypothetical protein
MECGFCGRGDISISEDFECEDYESYLDTEEWKKPFWKRMLDRDNNRTCRVRYYGKEIEINGRKFFSESKSEYAHLTDEITGMRCGSKDLIQEKFGLIVSCSNKVDIPLLELPIATYDEQKGVFTYEEKGGAE